MVKNILSTNNIIGKTAIVSAKMAGTTVKITNGCITKSNMSPITKIDMLLSDVYTNCIDTISSMKLDDCFLTYNYEENLIFCDTIKRDGIVMVSPVTITLTDLLISQMKMRHNNKILSSLGFSDHKKYIKSLIFRIDGIPSKYIIRDDKNANIPKYLIEMVSSLFLYKEIDVVNIYDDRDDSIISIANQIFNKADKNHIDIPSKLDTIGYLNETDIAKKIGMINNVHTRDVLSRNMGFFHFYRILIILLLTTKYDSDMPLLCSINLTNYRYIINSTRKRVDNNKLKECSA